MEGQGRWGKGAVRKLLEGSEGLSGIGASSGDGGGLEMETGEGGEAGEERFEGCSERVSRKVIVESSVAGTFCTQGWTCLSWGELGV